MFHTIQLLCSIAINLSKVAAMQLQHHLLQRKLQKLQARLP